VVVAGKPTVGGSNTRLATSSGAASQGGANAVSAASRRCDAYQSPRGARRVRIQTRHPLGVRTSTTVEVIGDTGCVDAARRAGTPTARAQRDGQVGESRHTPEPDSKHVDRGVEWPTAPAA